MNSVIYAIKFLYTCWNVYSITQFLENMEIQSCIEVITVSDCIRLYIVYGIPRKTSQPRTVELSDSKPGQNTSPTLDVVEEKEPRLAKF